MGRVLLTVRLIIARHNRRVCSRARKISNRMKQVRGIVQNLLRIQETNIKLKFLLHKWPIFPLWPSIQLDISLLLRYVTGILFWRNGASWLSERYPASALFLVLTITNKASYRKNSELLVKFLSS